METRLFISRVSTWLLPTASISLLRLLISLLRRSFTQTCLFSLWGYLTGRLPSSACQSQHLARHGVGRAWFLWSLLLMCQRVLEHSADGECPAVEIDPEFCLFSLTSNAFFSLAHDFWSVLKMKTVSGVAALSRSFI